MISKETFEESMNRKYFQYLDNDERLRMLDILRYGKLDQIYEKAVKYNEK